MGRVARTAVVTAAVLACLQASPASADTVEHVVTGEHLQLVSVTSPAMSSLSPGQAATWDVGVSVTTPGDATVDVRLQVLTATTDTFEMKVSRCDQRWTAEGCTSGGTTLAAEPVTAGAGTALGSTDAGDTPWYRVTVTMVGDSNAAAASLRLTADGVGEELSADTGPGAQDPEQGPLPGAGVAVLPQVALALGAVLAGLLLAASARRRTRGGRT